MDLCLERLSWGFVQHNVALSCIIPLLISKYIPTQSIQPLPVPHPSCGPSLLPPIYEQLGLPSTLVWKRTTQLVREYHTASDFASVYVALDVYQRAKHLDQVDPSPLIRDSIRRLRMSVR